MKKYKLDTVVHLNLENIFEIVEYNWEKTKPNFGLLLGDTGDGKTSFATQYVKILNEMNGFDWDVNDMLF